MELTDLIIEKNIMASHTCTHRCGIKCDNCGMCRERVYVGNCETGRVILDECKYCSPIKVNCYVCGTSMRTYKTKHDNTIQVAPCSACVRKTSIVRRPNFDLTSYYKHRVQQFLTFHFGELNK